MEKPLTSVELLLDTPDRRHSKMLLTNEPHCKKTCLRVSDQVPHKLVTAQLICAFVFAHAKSSFSHDEAQMSNMDQKLLEKAFLMQNCHQLTTICDQRHCF